MWELLDAEWMECLRREPVESLLKLPSGCVQEHWPATLREFVLTARSLVIPRERKAPQSLVPDIHVASIGTVLAQGMNSKKKHEIENLAAVVHAIAKSCGAKTVVGVGSGQGYLAQALSFEYQLPVVAIDASSHHASVTVARAERIKKHYAVKWCNLHQDHFQFYYLWVGTCCYKLLPIIFAVWRSNFSKYLGLSPVMFFLVTHWQLSHWMHVRMAMVKI